MWFNNTRDHGIERLDRSWMTMKTLIYTCYQLRKKD